MNIEKLEKSYVLYVVHVDDVLVPFATDDLANECFDILQNHYVEFRVNFEVMFLTREVCVYNRGSFYSVTVRQNVHSLQTVQYCNNVNDMKGLDRRNMFLSFFGEGPRRKSKIIEKIEIFATRWVCGLPVDSWMSKKIKS